MLQVAVALLRHDMRAYIEPRVDSCKDQHERASKQGSTVSHSSIFQVFSNYFYITVIVLLVILTTGNFI